MNLPNLLKPWSTIWICSPSKRIHDSQKESLKNFTDYIESLWMKIVLSEEFFWMDKRWISSGTPQQRADAINSFFADPNIDAIRCFQWWENCIEIVDLLNYELIKKNPKLLLGKSDIDVLLLAIYEKTWITTIHCPDTKIGWKNKEMDFEYNKKRFEKRIMHWEIWMIESTFTRKTIRWWTSEWKILWCNLNSLMKLHWTWFLPSLKNSILFIEVYRANSWLFLAHLKKLDLQWTFNEISWIVIWYNYWYQDSKQQEKLQKNKDWNYNQLEYLILDVTKKYAFPILKIEEFGHYCPNCFLPIWAQCKLDADAQTIEIL